jgi:hypothetical protein
MTDTNRIITTANGHSLTWDRIGDFYCADGDGFVAVEVTDGKYILTADQGDFIAEFDNLNDAMTAAQSYLAAEYPAIYADLIDK